MVEFYHFKCFEKQSDLTHAVSHKSIEHPYDFSLALHTGEEEEKIIQNRSAIVKYLSTNKPLHFIVANQTHSDHVKVITGQKTQGWSTLQDAVEDCDALITQEKNVILCILTADCVPILLYDPENKVVAAVHAGWKGSKAGIVSKTVQKMQDTFGSKAEKIIAGVAPSIGGCCYEVDEEVAKHFFEIPESFSKRGNKYMLDLPYINKYQLLGSGLKEENIEMSGVCTACDVEKYFSYRKEQGCSGRFMSMIGMV